MSHRLALSLATLTLSAACASPSGSPTPAPQRGDVEVTQAQASGAPDAYTLSVEVRSADTGCEAYADWWEVTDADGQTLHYRRILAHSHVDEQPFTRSGGPVPVGADDEVVVRAHFAPTGYGRAALRGSVAGGFEAVTLPEGFGASLEGAAPLPDGCAF
jgi:hypothetical protein